MQAKTTFLKLYIFIHLMLLNLSVGAEVKLSLPDATNSAVLEAKLKDLTSDGYGGNLYNYGHQVMVDGEQALVHGSGQNELIILNYNGVQWVESEVIFLDQSIRITGMAITGDYIFVTYGDKTLSSINYKVYIYKKVNGNWIESGELVPSQTENPQYFGEDISASGNVVVVGARYIGGEAYIFELIQGTWTETAILLPSDGFRNSFGAPVSIHGNKIFVGSGHDSSVYYFEGENGEWNEKQKIAANDYTGYGFGDSIVIGENYAAIANPRRVNDIDQETGMVFIYKFNGTIWENDQSFQPPIPQDNLRYGAALAIHGDQLLVGAPGYIQWYENTIEGKAFLYQNNGNFWELKNTFQAPDGHGNNAFGFSMGLLPDQALIGAHLDTGNAFESGAVYVAKKNGDFWAINQKQVTDISSRHNQLGISGAAFENTILLGSSYESSIDHGANSGSAIFYERHNGSWTQSTKIVANDSHDKKYFGQNVCLADNLALIKSRLNEEVDPIRHTYYVFEKIQGVWSQTANLTGFNEKSFTNCDIDGEQFALGYVQPESTGGAYIYEKINSQWQVVAELTTSETEIDDKFGVSVALSGDMAFIGASSDSTTEFKAGAVYIFEKSGGTWQNTNKINAEQPIRQEYFGSDLSFDGENLLVGAYGGYPIGTNLPGAAYLFENSGNLWSQTQRFIPNDVPVNTNTSYGYSVAIDDQRVVISSRKGGVYVYESTDGLWLLVDRFMSDYMLENHNSTESNFVSLYNDLLVFGSPYDDEIHKSSGAAYIHNYTIYPTGVNDEFEVLEDSVNVMLNVLSNDIDYEDGAIESVTQPNNGQTSISKNQVLYTPNADFCNYGQVTDQFNYQLNGGSSAQVEVDVSCVNDRPSFSHLGNQSTQIIGPQLIPNWAYNLKVGPENEAQNQTIEEFEVTIISDPNNVLTSTSVDHNGELFFIASGQIGTAVLQVKMLDDGGTDNGGIQWSLENEFTIEFNDVIFKTGFE